MCGCGKLGSKDIVKELNNKINNSKSYHLTATLDIYRNEEKYTYDVDSSYKSDNLFKVDLINKNNEHEQIILKNDEGVYVITHKSTQLLKIK